jgi:hypothetical protein
MLRISVETFGCHTLNMPGDDARMPELVPARLVRPGDVISFPDQASCPPRRVNRVGVLSGADVTEMRILVFDDDLRTEHWRRHDRGVLRHFHADLPQPRDGAGS